MSAGVSVFPSLGFANIADIALCFQAVAWPAKRAKVLVGIVPADLQRNVMVEVVASLIGRLKAHLAGSVEPLPDGAPGTV